MASDEEETFSIDSGDYDREEQEPDCSTLSRSSNPASQVTPWIRNGTVNSDSIPAIPGSVSEAEARRRQQKSLQLLAGMDHSSGGDSADELSMSLMSKTVGSWMRNAAAFITPTHSQSIKQASTDTLVKQEEKVVDATDSICSYPNCVQALNIAVSRFHCRKCNGWYCSRHAGHPSYGLKLHVGTGQPSKDGVWSRICELCFHDYFYPKIWEPAPFKDYTFQFVAARDRFQRETNEKIASLIRRLSKLAAHQKDASPILPFRVYERTIVEWEEDDRVKACFQCSEVFGALNRKHHCRLCGRIICGESRCSRFVPITDVAEIRICAHCANLLELGHRRAAFRKPPEFNVELEAHYSETEQIKEQIDGIVPRFNDQLHRFEFELQSSEPDEAKLMSIRHEAMAARDTLVLLFRHVEALLRKIRALPRLHGIDEDCLRAQMCQNIHRAGVLYLQENMIPLQQLPTLDLKRLLKPAPDPAPSQDADNDTAASGPSSYLPKFFSSLLSPNQEDSQDIPKPANIPALQEKVDVLKEQKMQLEGFLATAVQGQKFDDVRAIRTSLEEVNREIHAISRIFRKLKL